MGEGLADILWLEVAVGDAEGVEVLQRQHEARGVELHGRLLHRPILFKNLRPAAHARPFTRARLQLGCEPVRRKWQAAQPTRRATNTESDGEVRQATAPFARSATSVRTCRR